MRRLTSNRPRRGPGRVRSCRKNSNSNSNNGNKSSRLLTLGLLSLLLAACGNNFSGLMGGAAGDGAGARSGGAQDTALARSKVDAGQVPTAADFPLEGLFAENDLPIAGPECTEPFCARAATAVADALALAPDAGRSSFVQVGMVSNIDLSSFRRRPLNAAIVLDNSGSMGTDKMQAVKSAALKLVDNLNEGDVLVVVRFDHESETLIGPAPVQDKEAFKKAIGRLAAAGSTCIECGLKEGFARLDQFHGPARDTRLFLMTDALPNVGETGPSEFMSLLEEHAARGAFASLFGVGLDFGQALATRISSVRGANYVFLETNEKAATVFDADFDLLVTPVAFDLKLEHAAEPGVELKAVYGIPGEAPKSLALSVATVFLSRTRGATLLELSAVEPGASLGRLELRYSTPDGVAKSDSFTLAAPAGAAPSFSDPGIHRTLTLARLGTLLREVCARVEAGELAAARLLSAEAVVIAQREAQDDPVLADEVALVQQLDALVRARG
jgi:Ca-activated chloride channel family protein